jgi:dipeptidyl aminopeptidase/acylaminoacyl peptidase
LTETVKKRTMTVDDLAKLRSFGDISISPDGGRVAYTVKTINLEENKREADIYAVETSGGEPVKLTDDGKNSLPTWSPDGKRIAFVQSVDGGKKRIAVMDSEGKNRRKIWDYEVSNASLGARTPRSRSSPGHSTRPSTATPT